MPRVEVEEAVLWTLMDDKMRMEQMEKYIIDHAIGLARVGLLDGMEAILSRRFYSMLKDG